MLSFPDGAVTLVGQDPLPMTGTVELLGEPVPDTTSPHSVRVVSDPLGMRPPTSAGTAGVLGHYYFMVSSGATSGMYLFAITALFGNSAGGGWSSSIADVWDGTHSPLYGVLVLGYACADGDGDGMPDAFDNCPAVPNADQANTDGDVTGDACDSDDDNDDIVDGSDNCPLDHNPSQGDMDSDGTGNPCDLDTDGDGAPNASDADDDNDGVSDSASPGDNCRTQPNPDQRDTDGDAVGDVCDGDLDGDGVCNAAGPLPAGIGGPFAGGCSRAPTGVDNCPDAGNPGQQDNDGDALGDDCDPDDDNDAILDASDNCPLIANPGQQNDVHPGTPAGDHCENPDGDGVFDVSDNCPDTWNPDQRNNDGDPLGDACDPDDDNDMVPDAMFDNCPFTPNPGQVDLDGDGVGNACDADVDGDGILNADDHDDDADGYWDTDETVKQSDPRDINALSIPEHCDGVDNDGDTVIDEAPGGAAWDIDGDTVKDCLDATVDTDGDTVVNTLDADDDGDGRTDVQERKLSTDELGPCPTGASHDGWGSDRDRDKDADIGDVIANFGMGKINNPPNYDARSDADADGDDDIGDVIQLYGMGRINTKCASYTFTNGTGSSVDDIHIVWSAAIAEVYVARDSALAGWSNRAISGGGMVLDMDRPDGSGDLGAGGTLTVVIRTASSTLPLATTCQWTLDGANKGAC
ncbi:MAG TPA: thrombospondin type 3 repeat-containing protein [Dehalococcoidia bacterium]|nr:thrombospondin type 3 repeat-containing protein [Dehalococcoidia bacterium]